MKDGVMITCQDYPAALIITSSCWFRWSSRAFKGRRRSRGRRRQTPQKKNHACSFLSASPDQVKVLRMNASAAAAGGAKAAPPKFKQKDSRQFKSKAPRPGQKGFDNDVPGMEGLGDSAVVCPWEAFGDMELSDLAQFGIV